ncbi:MAG: VTT domain-containing protein [Ruminococcus sp.]|nr:VTT domain-containing protein [Ruminococcus sp.]
MKLYKQNSFELKKIKNGFLNILRFVPLILCVIFMAIYLFSDEEISAENLLNYVPEKPLYAAIFLVLLYALKSLTIVFPLIVLKLLGGFIFDPIDAIIVNSIGALVELIVPYLVGRLSGAKFVEKICAKYPKINEIFGSNDNSDFFISFFLRIIDFLPGDVISMAFGKRKFPFFTFLVGSFLGMLPGIIMATLLGTSITDPTSPMFWISISLTVGLSVSSALIYYIWRKKKILS